MTKPYSRPWDAGTVAQQVALENHTSAVFSSRPALHEYEDSELCVYN